MKQKFFFLFLGLVVSVASAQDVIVLKNTDEIEVKVLEISPESVKYVVWEAQDGPLRVIDKRDIFFIKYQNGQKETFEPTGPAFGREEAVGRNANTAFGKYLHRIKPQGYIYGGMTFNGFEIGPIADVAFGARFYDYFFLGVELGYACWFVRVYNDAPYYRAWDALHFAALKLNMKAYLPVTERFSSFADLSLGLSIWLPGVFGFFNMRLGLGVEYKRFTIGAGYDLLALHGALHTGYLRLGVRL